MYILYFVSCVNVYMLVVAILLCTHKHQSVSLLLLFYFFKEIIRVKIRRVWRYQRGNQNPHIEEEQTTVGGREVVRACGREGVRACGRACVTRFYAYL